MHIYFLFMSLLKKVQLLPIKAQTLLRRKVELFGFDTFSVDSLYTLYTRG